MKYIIESNWSLDVGIAQFYENPTNVLSNNVSLNTNDGMHRNRNGNVNAAPQARQQARHANGNVNNNNNNNNNNSGGHGLITRLLYGLCSVFPLVFSLLGSVIGFILGFASTSVNYGDLYNEFIQRYGNNFSFFKNMAFQRVMQGSRRESNGVECSKNRAILVYFYNSDNEGCDNHIRRVLNNEAIIDYIRVNFDCWLGNVAHNQARQLFSQVTRDWQDRRLPFILICGVHPNTRRLTIVHRQYVGQLNSNQLLANVLDRGLQRWDGLKLTVYNQMLEQSHSRMVREQQDEEYERLLREARMQEMVERNDDAKTAESSLLNGNINSISNSNTDSIDNDNNDNNNNNNNDKMQQVIEERSKYALSQLSQEPEKNESDENKIVKIAMRLPTGKRLQRNFLQNQTVQVCWVKKKKSSFFFKFQQNVEISIIFCCFCLFCFVCFVQNRCFIIGLSHILKRLKWMMNLWKNGKYVVIIQEKLLHNVNKH